jgi:hypothetical protein
VRAKGAITSDGAAALQVATALASPPRGAVCPVKRLGGAPDGRGGGLVPALSVTPLRRCAGFLAALTWTRPFAGLATLSAAPLCAVRPGVGRSGTRWPPASSSATPAAT